MKTSQAGLTILELMVTVAILAILTALAVPTFREYTRNSNASAAQNDLVTALNYARSESLRRGTRVTVCASADGESCGDADDWISGWIVFTDASGAAGTVNAPDDVVLQRWQAVQGALEFEANEPYVQYHPTGRVSPETVKTFKISWPDCSGNKVRKVSLNVVGLLTSTKEACPES